jgi:hypothetical protein
LSNRLLKLLDAAKRYSSPPRGLPARNFTEVGRFALFETMSRQRELPAGKVRLLLGLTGESIGSSKSCDRSEREEVARK